MILYYARTPADPEVWTLQLGTGQESPLSPAVRLQQWRDWVLVDNGIFFLREARSPHPLLQFFDFAKTRIKDVAALEKPSEWLSASADGKYVLYHQDDADESSLMMLENFH